jgi:RNA-directed DNA polymerase
LGRDLPAAGQHYLHVLDTECTQRRPEEPVRYADDGVVLCRSAAQVRVALEAIRGILAGAGGWGCTRTRRS